MPIRVLSAKDGEIARFQVPDGSKLFLESMPHSLRLRRAGLIGGKGEPLWEFYFPFYIRTAMGPWNASKEAMHVALDIISDCQTTDQVVEQLYDRGFRRLMDWVWINGSQVRAEGLEKLKDHAAKHYRDRSTFLTSTFRRASANLPAETPTPVVGLFSAAADTIEHDDPSYVTRAVSALSDEDLATAYSAAILANQSFATTAGKRELFEFEIFFIMYALQDEMARRSR